MKNRIVTNGMKAWLSLAMLLAVCGASATDYTSWNGEDGAYLNDAANWNGTAPFLGTSSNGMTFGNVPSTAYTVKLSDDLVCAATWKFDNDWITTTWDLGGHTMTFLSGYSSNEHRGRTNIVMNGTLAFTNQTGTIQTLQYSSARECAALLLREKANFIGNINFTDDGRGKTLEVTDGAHMKGTIGISGTAARGLVSGEGTVVDLGGYQKACDIGDEGTGAKLEILDGAVVTNGTWLKVGATSRCKGFGGEVIVSNATFRLDYPSSTYVAIGGMKYTGSSSAGYTFASASHNNSAKFIDGAKVLVTNAEFYVGSGLSHSNALYIAGKDTVVEVVAVNPNQATPLVVGRNGNWNELHLTDGSTMTSDYIVAGGQNSTYSSNASFGRYGTTSLWNRVTIDKGAVLNARGGLHLGWRHSEDINNDSVAKSLMASNVIEIASGAKVTTAQNAVIGVYETSRDNKLIIRDEGTSLGLPEGAKYVVSIGLDGGNGNGVEVLDGATLSNVYCLRIGAEIHYLGNESLQTTGSNNYFKVENTALTVGEGGINIGYFNNGGNCLYVGEGATLNTSYVLMRGMGQEIVASNGVLSVTGDKGLQVCFKENAHTETESGKQKISFYEQGRIVLGEKNSKYGTFTNACTFAFHVPKDGYALAPLESQNAALKFSDDTEFVFDFSAASENGLKDVPLMSYTGSGAAGSRLVISDTLLAKINSAATKARHGSRVNLSTDGKSLTLRVGSQGLAIVVR